METQLHCTNAALLSSIKQSVKIRRNMCRVCVLDLIKCRDIENWEAISFPMCSIFQRIVGLQSIQGGWMDGWMVRV